MLSKVMHALAHVAVLVTLVAAPALVEAASDIGDRANLEAVLLNGEKVNLENWKGKVVMVNFWATWCPDCVKEMPKLVDTHRKFAARGYETVAVAVRQDKP
ncbi:MAG: TlpA disulfide reductase family protein, partial [bacterium]